MGRILWIAAAIVVLTASWVGAGSFDVLAGAAGLRPSTPLYVQSPKLVKAGFSSDMRTSSDMELDTDSPPAGTVTPAAASQSQARPAVAFRERPAGTMAPPPKPGKHAESDRSTFAQLKDDVNSLESDLEKDLVISPPPAKTEESEAVQSKPPVVERKPAAEKSVLSAEKADRQKVKQRAKKPAPDFGQYASNGKPIRKVRPVSQGSWNYAAGSHRPAPVQENGYRPAMADEMYGPSAAFEQRRYPGNRQTMSSDPRRTIALPPTADRFVRDGVTVKLAPASAGASCPPEYGYGEDTGADILGAAAEIIGLPFAFISSLF
ncbi:MAG: hypothetical protein HY914_03380 [Desulfomonile tiedjei]|nr:hypothetical protein [Desulfomonile tiedjei]